MTPRVLIVLAFRLTLLSMGWIINADIKHAGEEGREGGIGNSST